MQVACPSCAHVITVPPEKAALPNLKAKCRCGTLFALTPPPPPPPLPPTAPSPVRPAAAVPQVAIPRVAPAANERVAAIRAANAQAAAALTPPPLPARPPGVPAGAPLRTAAAVPRPAPVPVAGPGGAPEKPRTVPVPWRRCQNHPTMRAEQVCPKCAKGFCDPCTQKVQTAAICPACEGLCVAAAAYEQLQDRTRQRDRSMMDEVPTIVRYPLVDPIAYVLLALFTWFFGLFAGLAFIMAVLSKGVLTWYSFNAVSKVSIGNLRDVMPEFRDLSDITHAMRLSVAALAISGGPLLLCLLLIPGAEMLTRARSVTDTPRLSAVHAAQPTPASPAAEEDDEPRSPFEADRDGAVSVFGPLALLGIVVAALWMLVYMPVALTVAALSKSMLSTLNPLIGADTMKKMGGTYWQALAIYAALVSLQLLLGWGLRHIPFAGSLAASFVDAYAALAVGCTLGMAVFKKAAALGWD
jgi:hypothetical protein